MHNSLRLRRTLAVSASAFAIMAIAAPAFAQDEPAPTGTTVGELIITAQNGLPASVVAPSLLFEEVEVRGARGEPKHLPLLAEPPMSAKGSL